MFGKRFEEFKYPMPKEEQVLEQFLTMNEMMQERNYSIYQISNAALVDESMPKKYARLLNS